MVSHSHGGAPTEEDSLLSASIKVMSTGFCHGWCTAIAYHFYATTS